MSVSKTAGSKIYIGTTAPAVTLEDFEGDAYVSISEVADLGELGDSFNELTRAPVDAARVKRVKGMRDGGTLELVIDRVAGDPGQLALLAAAADGSLVADYNFKIVLADAATGGSPTEFFFRAAVMGHRVAMGQGDQIVQLRFPLAINSDILEVAPDPGPMLPGTIDDLAAIVTGSDSVQLWFTAAANAQSHQVRYSEAGQNDWSTPATIVPGGTVEGLDPETEYDFAVRGVNAVSFGEWSDPVTAETEAE